MNTPLFRGAMVRLDRDVEELTFPYMVQWDRAEYDTDEFFNPSLPTVLTVPKGVTVVRLYGGVELGVDTTTFHSTFVNFRKNDRTFQGNPASNIRQGTIGWSKNVYTIASPPIMVEHGDEIELRLNNSTMTEGKTLLKAAPSTYMAIEVVGGEINE